MGVDFFFKNPGLTETSNTFEKNSFLTFFVVAQEHDFSFEANDLLSSYVFDLGMSRSLGCFFLWSLS